ncbi:16S rRNA processing protein RimM [Sphingomonas rhizophila]|jgi:16S rRNA processing protein RimM|uniref:Ribosome maturation factor RimM n=1 Tax=Sphingomonas rhizophila TaxID=2071607 RepID=A0A7G9SDJ4_9SPHN|nr:ribosome maturation factor RimM [Sphingomonas rhizophila]QNN65919.1 16S rRNA processing protein RimM [Sphingomonas rhizophila]
MTSSETGAGKRVALAAVAGAHGIKGEVRLKLFGDSIAGLAAQPNVFVGGQTLRLLSAKEAGKTAIARFEGVTDRSAAEALRGSLIEVERDTLPPLDEGEYYHADLIGLPCLDEDGNAIGTVVAVENFGAGDLIEVELPSGRKSLVPFRDPVARLDDDRIVLDPDFLA